MSEVLEPQYQDLEQQRHASTQGMWVFLATEVLFFGTLFVGYTALRVTYPEDFKTAAHAINLVFGSVNTAVLMTSSLFMALAVRAAREGRRFRIVALLAITWFLGAAFLTTKGFEYAYDLRHHSIPGPGLEIEGHAVTPPMHLFMSLYWVMTGFHALHMTVGLGAVAWTIKQALFGKFSTQYYAPVEVVGLYWHFVDLIWIFLYPALYLAGVGAK